MNRIDVYTDGSSLCFTHEGGIGVVILFDDVVVKTISRGFKDLKTGQAELLAIYFALKECTYKVAPIFIHSDSEYAIKSFTEWWSKWEKMHFIGIKNQKLLRAVKGELDKFTSVGWEHVKGHTGNIYNEQADYLASKGRVLYINRSYKDFIKTL